MHDSEGGWVDDLVGFRAEGRGFEHCWVTMESYEIRIVVRFRFFSHEIICQDAENSRQGLQQKCSMSLAKSIF